MLNHLVIIVSCVICVRKRRVPVERSLLDPTNLSNPIPPPDTDEITFRSDMQDDLNDSRIVHFLIISFESRDKILIHRFTTLHVFLRIHMCFLLFITSERHSLIIT